MSLQVDASLETSFAQSYS